MASVRSPSLAAMAAKLYNQGIPCRVTRLPDGTMMLDTLTNGEVPLPTEARLQKESQNVDKVINGAFVKKLPKRR